MTSTTLPEGTITLSLTSSLLEFKQQALSYKVFRYIILVLTLKDKTGTQIIC